MDGKTVIMNVATLFGGEVLVVGQRKKVPVKVAHRWVNRGLAHWSDKSDIKIIRFNRGKKKKRVHIRDIHDGWIMQRFGDELAKLEDDDILFTIGKKPDNNADINYYVNWTNERPSLFDLPKTKMDIILFTHLEKLKENYIKESKVIRWADKFVCMAKHGEMELAKRGVPKSKIAVSEGIGVSIDFRKKIKIGWAGKPNFCSGRKGNKDFQKLTKDLDNSIFKFILYGTNPQLHSMSKQFMGNGSDIEITKDYKYFLNNIDYYLSPSEIEGGPMDMLNAFYSGIPVVSRNIGFFYTIKTKDDYCFKNYKDLLEFFIKKQNAKNRKFKIVESYNWDNYRKWHIKYFRKLLLL